MPSLSHDDQFDDSDAEEIADDVSTDFTDSEEESESSNCSGGTQLHVYLFEQSYFYLFS